nr:TlpA family protein disulfide reductase [Desulfuromonadales bacterium]
VRLSDYQGRFVLLKLGSTQCPSCLEQIETIQDLGEFLKKKDIVFLDIFLRDSEEMIRETMKGEKFPMTSEILVGDIDVYKAYRVFLIPRLLLIDPSGKVVRDGSIWPAYKMKQRIQELCPDDKAREDT